MIPSTRSGSPTVFHFQEDTPVRIFTECMDLESTIIFPLYIRIGDLPNLYIFYGSAPTLITIIPVYHFSLQMARAYKPNTGLLVSRSTWTHNGGTNFR